MIYRFERSGRNRRTLWVLGLIWGALGLALWRLDASGWIAAGLFAVTLPALWDFITARPAGLELDDTALRWWSGRHKGDARLDSIDHVRFDTRLDLSVRVRLVLANASRRKLTIPQDALPLWQELQRQFEARGVSVQRHHFSVF
ncbi:hypothetical protein [Tropicibacter oceani]|uniref:Uncharacterized protein n=1 Tax=Tropicibacter oceani TaxID=3058420 RepID=A0ABY8QH07_9RHOB|nr:hypothetical protein [Tropicibacter oceani]WGW03278.1 hypothetical protein QF118_15295 [Tropicibacter oceani]